MQRILGLRALASQVSRLRSPLQPIELLWLLAVPAAAGLIALITARLSVLAALRAIH